MAVGSPERKTAKGTRLPGTEIARKGIDATRSRNGGNETTIKVVLRIRYDALLFCVIFELVNAHVSRRNCGVIQRNETYDRVPTNRRYGNDYRVTVLQLAPRSDLSDVSSRLHRCVNSNRVRFVRHRTDAHLSNGIRSQTIFSNSSWSKKYSRSKTAEIRVHELIAFIAVDSFRREKHVSLFGCTVFKSVEKSRKILPFKI